MDKGDVPLFERLMNLVEKTESARELSPAAWWMGDAAGQRKVRDDLEAGRLDWRRANQCARHGIKALEAGDRDMAEIYAWNATDSYIAALETRIRPSDLQVLGRSAQKRGRPRKK